MSADYWISLPDDFAAYRDSKGTALGDFGDRSGIELKIITFLRRRDWSEDEILDYFNFHEFPKHLEDFEESGDYLATLSRIARADEYIEEKGLGSSSKEVCGAAPPTNHPVVESEHNLGFQIYGYGVLAFDALRIVRAWEESGETYNLTDWRQEIIEASKSHPWKPASLMTARRLTADLVAEGYVTLEEIDGRSRRPRLTEKGWRSSTFIRGKWRQYIFLGTPPASAEPNQEQVELVAAEEPEPEPAFWQEPDKGKRIIHTRRDPNDLRIELHRKNNDINGHYRLSFKRNKIRYIQLLAPIEETFSAPLWRLPVGYDTQDLLLTETVAADETNDPLDTLTPEGWHASAQCVLPAVELSKTDTGFEVAEYIDEIGELRPCIGVIYQSDFNFFKPLAKTNPDGRIIRVQGKDTRKKRRYLFEDAGEARDLEIEFDFDAFVEDLISQEHLDRAMAVLDGWYHMRKHRRKLIHLLDRLTIDDVLTRLTSGQPL